jgi:hypothetical protein
VVAVAHDLGAEAFCELREAEAPAH